MRIVFVVLLSLIFFNISAQSDKYLKSKLNYCKTEVEQLEQKVSKYENLLALQTKEVQELKVKIQDKDMEIEQLERDKLKMIEVAVNMLNLALKFEQEGKYKEAMEVYKILIKSYPTTLEAAASRIKVTDLTKNLDNYK